MSQFGAILGGLGGGGGANLGATSSGGANNRSVNVLGGSSTTDLDRLLQYAYGPEANGGFNGNRTYANPLSSILPSGSVTVGGNLSLPILLAVGGVALWLLLRK